MPVIPPTNLPFSSFPSSFCYCLTFFHSCPFPEKKKKEYSLANILNWFNSSADSLPGCLVSLRVRKEPGELDAGSLSYGKAFLSVFQAVFLIHISVPSSSPPLLQTSSKLIQGPRQWCYRGGFLKIQIPGSHPLSSESKSLRLEFRTGDAKMSS